MSERLPDLIARLRLDLSDMESGVSRASAIGGAIGGALGGVIATGVGAAFSQVSQFVNGSVDAFANLEDSTAAAGVVFGQSMATVIEQSKTAAGSLGLSSQQVINAANTFGTYGKAAGLAGADLATFSTDLTGLAGDLASFKGTTTEQAIEAIGSALRGEAEPIRAYGVLLDDATLKAEALALGIADGTSTLTPQQKVLAAQSAILKQTADAQGDFARTQDSTANTARVLAAETENLQAKVGGLLAPAFTTARVAGIEMVRSVSTALDTMIPRVQAVYEQVQGSVGPALATVRDTITGVVSTIGPGLAETFAPVGDAVRQLAPTLLALAPQVLSLASAFSPLHLVMQALLPVLPTLAGVLSTVLTTILGAVGDVLPVLVQLGAVLAGALSDAVVSLAPVIAQLATTLGGILSQAVTTLVPVVLQLATTLGATLGRVVTALAPVIAQLAGVVLSLMPVLAALIPPILSVVTALLPLVDVVAGLIAELLPPLLDLFMAVIAPVAELATVLASALAPIITLVADLLSGALVPLLTTLIGVLAPVIAAVVDLAGGALGWLVNMLATVIGWVAQVIAALARWLGSLGGVGDAVRSMAETVGQRVGQVVDWFVGLPGRVVSGIGDLAGRLLQLGRDTVQGFIDGITGMGSNIIAAIRDTITDRLPSFVKDALGIASPSRVFRRLGGFVGDGFARGIADATGQVQAAAEDMVGAVSGVEVAPPVMSSPYVGASNPTGGGLTGGGNTAPVYVTVKIGDTELRGIITTEVNGVLVDEARAITNGASA